MNMLSLIIITISIALVFALLLKRVGVPPIVGYIFTGMIMTMFLDFNIVDQEVISEVAEFGVVFLMFSIGLEFSLTKLQQMKKEVFVFGSLQVIITSVVFSYLISSLTDLSLQTAIIVGSALSLSSTAIVLKTMKETGEIHRPYGKNSLGVLLFQDIAVIPILLMITIFANSDNIAVSDMLLNTFYSGAIALLVIYVLGKYATEAFLSFVIDSKELFIGSILLIVLSSAYVTHLFGLSYSLGAFFAGMIISETKYKHQIESDLIPFRDVLLSIFFVSVGLQVSFTFLFSNIGTIIALTIGILAIKALLIFLILRMFTFTKRAFKTSLAISQVGEFSFAVFAVAEANHLLQDQYVHQLLISIVILSLLITSLSIKHIRKFADFFFKYKSEKQENPITTSEIKNHVIVCGYSLLGQKIVRKLKETGTQYMAIEHSQNHVETGEKAGDMVLFGNAASKDMLNSVYIKHAAAIIIAIDNSDNIKLICNIIQNMNIDISIIVKVSQKSQIEDLEGLNISYFINENETVASSIVDKAIKCELKPQVIS